MGGHSRGTVESRMRFAIALAALSVGCGGAVIEPGHRGLLFDPSSGGLQHEVLAPGTHHVGMSGRIDDFDVTYSTRTETVAVITSEGLPFGVHASVIFRPIIAELYELDSEVGPHYDAEIIGPEFRAATRAIFAVHSYTDLLKRNVKVEDEIEADVRRRISGKHIEIASVTLEAIQLPPELASAVRAREVAAQNAMREKLEADAEAARAARP